MPNCYYCNQPFPSAEHYSNMLCRGCRQHLLAVVHRYGVEYDRLVASQDNLRSFINNLSSNQEKDRLINTVSHLMNDKPEDRPLTRYIYDLLY